MRKSMLATLPLLAACNSPAPNLWSGETIWLKSGDHSFKVIHANGRAEAYRTNPAIGPKAADVFPAAIDAIERATGCRIDRASLQGDVALVTADLIC